MKTISIHLVIAFTVFFCFENLTFGNDRVNKKQSQVQLSEGGIVKKPLSFYSGPGIKLEGSNNVSEGGFMIHPERLTTLSGFYDWQTNGDCKHHVYYINPNLIHTAFMTAFDSASPDPSRRTVYSFSSDGGISWMSSNQVPNVRSGFAFLTAGNTGQSNQTAIIANHLGTSLGTVIHVDAFPGLGSFTSYPSTGPGNFIWPQANIMSNGNVLVTGSTYHTGAATDTLTMRVLNPNTGTWTGTQQFFRSSATDHLSMRWTSAAGPAGNGVMVMSPISDIGGSFGRNRLFYWKTTDHGSSWAGPSVLFDTHIDTDGDTSSPWLGLDAVYDAYGNFYIAFNTLGAGGDYSSAKIWINRNGTQNKIIARNSDIPGSMQTAATPQANVCSMDWPSLATTENGHFVVCAYSVAKQNDIVNGFNSMDVYFSLVTAGLSVTGQPHPITSGINDERFVSLNRTVIDNYKIPLVYQKDPQPGSSSFNDAAPVSRASLVYREIEFLNPLSGIEFTGSTAPNIYTLHQNYPNPFNPSTNIKFDIPKSGNVRITVYNITGKQIAELLNQDLSPGTYETSWDADGFASGVYYYRFEADGFSKTNKMLLVR